jgi:Fe-S oxidoreductase
VPAPKAAELPVRDGERTPGKVAIFATCYVNYNEPGIGLDLLKGPRAQRHSLRAGRQGAVLRHAQAGAGRPGSGRQEQQANIPVLAKYAREGYAILAAVPSCTLMFKQEIPLMYPEDADVQAVKEAMWDPFEYLTSRRRDGLLRPSSRSRWAR